ncbi:MAG: PAAR domain-containing protein [Burkholderiaceae bacterium]|jgi:hypothetical protein|nr:PAAR domain-containing protein [Burkholderiaceae bacterium]
MYTRALIQTHDKTTSNGDIQARDNGLTLGNDEKYVCFEGDPVICPTCKSIGVTKCVPPYRPWTGHDGRQVNLDGDLCICKCFPPPQLKASQNSVTMIFEANEIAAIAGTGNWLTRCGHKPSECGLTHDQRFRLIDENTNEPLASVKYELECNGHTISGISDEEGFTDFVYSKNPESVKVYIEV